MSSATRRSAACSASSTPSRCQRTRTGHWSTRCCSGCSTALACGCPKHSAWNYATSTRPARPSRYATARTTRTASCPSPGAWPPPWKAISPPPTPAPNPPTSYSTPATLPGRRTSPRFTTGSGVTSPTPTSPISREARTSIRCGTASPWRTCAAGQPAAQTWWSCCPTCRPTWATPTCAEPSTTCS